MEGYEGLSKWNFAGGSTSLGRALSSYSLTPVATLSVF